MLLVALLLANSAPAFDAAVGVDVGPTLALPPSAFAHVGGFARLRFDSIVVRPELSVDATIYPIGLQTGDVCVQWASDLSDQLEIAAGVGPAFGFVMTVVTDSPHPQIFIPGFGGVALVTVDYKAGDHVLWSAGARVLASAAGYSHLGDGGVLAASLMGSVAYRF